MSSTQKIANKEIVWICSDHEREFENLTFDEFCLNERILYEFSSPLTPQQNGVIEHKNRTLQEMAWVMFHAKSLPLYF